ncbi:DUF4389 domain-containing protein, partial [Mycolicibacterium austroafricanum]
QLSRGLVVVKWWLLAIPHYLIVLAFLLPVLRFIFRPGGFSLSLLVLLVVISAIALLFNGRYPPGLFDLIVGIDRWVLRVRAYASLMCDEYPPFRLDQGPREPHEAITTGLDSPPERGEAVA